MVEKLKIHDGGTSVFSKNTVTSYDSFVTFLMIFIYACALTCALYFIIRMVEIFYLLDYPLKRSGALFS